MKKIRNKIRNLFTFIYIYCPYCEKYHDNLVLRLFSRPSKSKYVIICPYTFKIRTLQGTLNN